MGLNLVAIARRVLMAVASGEPVRWEDVDALAEGVLGDELVAAALAVRERGQHAIVRAVQLAGMIAAGAMVGSVDSDGTADGGAS